MVRTLSTNAHNIYGRNIMCKRTLRAFLFSLFGNTNRWHKHCIPVVYRRPSTVSIFERTHPPTNASFPLTQPPPVPPTQPISNFMFYLSGGSCCFIFYCISMFTIKSDLPPPPQPLIRLGVADICVKKKWDLPPPPTHHYWSSYLCSKKWVIGDGPGP